MVKVKVTGEIALVAPSTIMAIEVILTIRKIVAN